MSDLDSSDAESERSLRGGEYPYKRRRRTKEDAMLGVFGDDSDDNESGTKTTARGLSHKFVDFKRGGHLSSEGEEEEVIPDRPSFNIAHHADETAGSDVQDLADRRTRFEGPEQSRPITQPVFGQYTVLDAAFIPSATPRISSETVSQTINENEHIHKPSRPPRSMRQPAQAPVQTSSKLQTGKAARMMAMMGYKTGQGLGATGSGIVKPIEATLRSEQKAGLGSTDVRAEDRLEGTRGSRKAMSVEGSTNRAVGSKAQKPRVKYKTAHEIIDDAGGNLSIPENLRQILDRTGKAPRLLDSAEQISSDVQANDANAEYQSAQSARQEVERCASEWRGLEDRKLYLRAEMLRSQTLLTEAKERADLLQSVTEKTQQIMLSCDNMTDDETSLNRLFDNLLDLQNTSTESDIRMLELDAVAIALLTPTLRSLLSSWDVLGKPGAYSATLLPLAKLLRFENTAIEQANVAQRKATAWENFMSVVWLPRLRASLHSHSWDSSTQSSWLRVLEHWKIMIPNYMFQQIMDQIIVPQIKHNIKSWQPRSRSSPSLSSLFQWLPHLGEQLQDVLHTVRRKMSTVLGQWRPRDGPVQEIPHWRAVLGGKEIDALLTRHVVPKLADLLRRDLIIDPADQNLEVLQVVLDWRHILPIESLGQLFEAEFFPKWINLLYLWLIGDPNYEEISDWYEWWQDVLSNEAARVPAVARGFRNGLDMMATALENGPESLSPPAIGPIKPTDHGKYLKNQKNNAKTTQENHGQDEAIQLVSFQDVLEHWCAEHNLLLVPLRKPHASGNSLYRISGSGERSKSVVLYLRGDIVMMELKEENIFASVSLKNVLAALA